MTQISLKSDIGKASNRRHNASIWNSRNQEKLYSLSPDTIVGKTRHKFVQGVAASSVGKERIGTCAYSLWSDHFYRDQIIFIVIESSSLRSDRLLCNSFKMTLIISHVPCVRHNDNNTCPLPMHTTFDSSISILIAIFIAIRSTPLWSNHPKHAPIFQIQIPMHRRPPLRFSTDPKIVRKFWRNLERESP